MELAVVAVCVLLFLLFLVKREQIFAQERLTWAEERRELLNRIKPETAQIPNVEGMEIVEPIRSDEDWWNAHEQDLKDKDTYPYGYEEEVRGR